jgi:hypothetical protein
MNLDRIREIADAYQAAVQTNAAMEHRDLNEEAWAAILGASKCLSYPEEKRKELVKAALMEGSDRC